MKKKRLKTEHSKSVKKAPHHSEAIAQHKKSRLKARKRKDIKLIIAGIVVLLIVAAASVAFYLLSKNNSSGERIETNKDLIIDLLSAEVRPSELRTVVSTLGVTVKYDYSTIEADGQTTDASSTQTYVSGISYENDELVEPRDYSILRFAVRDEQESARLYSIDNTLSIVTNIRKDYLTDRLAKPENSGLDALQVIVKDTTKTQTDDGYTLKSSQDRVINTVTYKQLDFVKAIGAGEFSTEYTSTYYLTVQNGRPYFISIRTTSASKSGEVAQLEAIIKTATYQAPDSNALSSATASLVDTSVSLPKDSSYVPEKLDKDTLVDVVLRNQPSTVRVGSIRCGDATLRSGMVSTTIKDGCLGGIGSGSFITEDGYIATNGHVTTFSDSDLVSGGLYFAETYEEYVSKLKPILDFFVSIGNLTASDKESILDQIASGTLNMGALAQEIGEQSKPYVSIANDEKIYVIQTSNDPIRFKAGGERLAFELTDTNIKAEFVDDNYDSSIGTKELNIAKLTSTDVAILKAEGTFPVVQTSTFTSIGAGDLLTAIGYPAFVDDGLDTKSEKTVPSVTQGFVSEFIVDPTSTYTLAFTTVPISGGNSGGPSFNEDGEQIGLNTYGYITCPDGQCFGDGIVRDMGDLIALAEKNNITLSGESEISSNWNDGLNDFLVGNFKGAVDNFDAVIEAYPANYLAASLRKTAQSKIGSAEDLSKNFAKSKVPIYIASASSAAIIVFAVIGALIVHRHHKTHGSARKLPLQPIPESPYAWQQQAVVGAGFAPKHPEALVPNVPSPPPAVPMPPQQVAPAVKPAPAPVVTTIPLQKTPQTMPTNPYAWQQEAVANARKITIKDDSSEQK